MTNDSQRVYGIKCYGHYKPNCTYSLGDGLYIVPGGWEMVDYCGGQMRVNISYFVTTTFKTEDSLREKFRDWILFNSYILNYECSVFFYDEGRIGYTIEEFETGFMNSSDSADDYKSEDYNDIGMLVLGSRDKQMDLSYLNLYQTYTALSNKDKELIEWFEAKPSRMVTRPNSIYKVSYWQLFHFIILLGKIIGDPPNCVHNYDKCPECDFEPHPHHSVRRDKWLGNYLNELIEDNDVKEQYYKIISKAYTVRNKFAHHPLIDRSKHPDIPIGSTETYGDDRTIEEYKEDSVALSSLLLSLNDICRYLLLNKTFKLNFFKKIEPLQAVSVGSAGTA